MFVLPLKAKQVKFSVDMTGQLISPNGVHVMGDFQQLAGLGPDWDPGTAVMTKEGTTDIYSIVVNIPAFHKYEYRFVNGDQSYESEFVPDESRVGYNLIDNRWIYVDSTSNSIFEIGQILFAGNAPAGKKLLRVKVDMTDETISPNGVHLFYGTQPTFVRLYSFGNGVFENISYHAAGTHTYGFSNGNVLTAAETLTGSCAVGGKRTAAFINDTIVGTTCFASCGACKGVGIVSLVNEKSDFTFYPNPAAGEIMIELTSAMHEVTISDLSGAILKRSSHNNSSKMDLHDLAPGIYFLSVKNENQQVGTRKLVIN